MKEIILFDERLKVNSVVFLIPDFNLLSCELDNVHLNCCIVFYIAIIIKQNKFTILSQFLVKIKIIYFASSILKNIAVCPA